MESVSPSSPEAAVFSISGPVVTVRHASGLFMNELVAVGEERLLGEVVEIRPDGAVLQVYEETTGLKPGAPVSGLGLPLFVELGPGMIGRVFDGIQRPLAVMKQEKGPFVVRGRTGEALERYKAWSFAPCAAEGEAVSPGQAIGTVAETAAIRHHILVPPHLEGRLLHVAPEGLYTVDEPVAVLCGGRGERHEIRMIQRWPVRRARPVRERLLPREPLFTGQRVVDFFFPLAKGGTAAIPGGFGTGKTITQHQLSKWADAHIIVYIGCGERGNEMAGVLEDFPRLMDPHTGRPLIERTVLIANTSDMPVAAREASIYTGIAIAEYYRDMGYHVAVMADSTSRWAEALREISGRLEEMPAEEGFPAYLASRLAEFYERAGSVVTLGGSFGSVSIIGAVSPPGGDFSEPVTQHTRRFVSTFWALDKELAGARHFPAIHCLGSYSGYVSSISEWWKNVAGLDWVRIREEALSILKEEARLQNLVKLVGEDALHDEQKVILHGARLIREDFLQQSAYDPIDTYSAPRKQVLMLQVILRFMERMREIVLHRIPVGRAMALPVVEEIHRMKYTLEGDDPAPFQALHERLNRGFDDLLRQELGEGEGGGE